MNKPKPEKLPLYDEQVKSEVKPIRYEEPDKRPKPTPNPKKKKSV